MNVNIILASVVITLLMTIIILIKVIIHKNNKYTQFQNETTQNYIFLVTFAEFIMYTKSHTDNKKVNISIDDYADIENIQNQIIHEASIQMLNEVMRNQDHYGRNFKDKLTETVIKMIGNALDDDMKNEITEHVKSDIFNKYIRTKQYKELKDEFDIVTDKEIESGLQKIISKLVKSEMQKIFK